MIGCALGEPLSEYVFEYRQFLERDEFVASMSEQWITRAEVRRGDRELLERRDVGPTDFPLSGTARQSNEFAETFVTE